jgi:DNA-binding GntR family transcriptional regulator
MEKKSSSTEIIYRKIRKGIIDGQWLPGERLVTAKLASQFKVSRTPIREALKKLENDALVDIELNVGAVIRKVDIQEVKDIYELRVALESLAVKKVIENGPSPQLIQQLRALSKLRKNAKNFEEFESSDHAFHLLICRASQSKVLQEIIENYMVIAASFTMTPRILKSRKFSHGKLMLEHDEIIDAIEAEDTAKAMRLMKKHITSACKKLEAQYLKQQAQTV